MNTKFASFLYVCLAGVIQLKEQLDREVKEKINVVVTIQDEKYENIVPQHRVITGSDN